MSMSLTASDLLEIRSIFKEELTRELEPIMEQLQALTNDIKEIYGMITAAAQFNASLGETF